MTQSGQLPTTANSNHDSDCIPQLSWDFDVEITTKAHFRYGLPGFEHLSSFYIVNVKDFPPFHILVAEEEPRVNLLIIHTQLLSIYRNVDIPESELKKIGTADKNDVDIYVVVKVDQEQNILTVNLRAPILINKNSNSAYQAILDRKDLSVEYPLVPA